MGLPNLSVGWGKKTNAKEPVFLKLTMRTSPPPRIMGIPSFCMSVGSLQMDIQTVGLDGDPQNPRQTGSWQDQHSRREKSFIKIVVETAGWICWFSVSVNKIRNDLLTTNPSPPKLFQSRASRPFLQVKKYIRSVSVKTAGQGGYQFSMLSNRPQTMWNAV